MLMVAIRYGRGQILIEVEIVAGATYSPPPPPTSEYLSAPLMNF
jgi:hypothetical protein